MKNIIIALSIVLTTFNLQAQKVFTKNGSISFFSKSPLENISAKNNQVMSVLNISTGDMQFSVIVKNFHFEKSLMEEHFNENYLESDKFPKSIFKGKITDLSNIDLTKDGTYNVVVKGDLTLHGVTKNISAPGLIIIKNGLISTTSTFKVTLADYAISIPKLVKDNIAETIEISVNCTYDQKM